MLILNEQDIHDMGIDWGETIAVIEKAVMQMSKGDFSQPVKPYLRFKSPKNRIIAMPAYIGGDIDMAGIKWIASFPDNLRMGKPRAHSVVILNDSETGEPLSIIPTALLSVIRTVSVTGLVIKYFLASRPLEKIKIGITGFGPIGQYHLSMCLALLGDKIEKVKLFDLRDIPAALVPGNGQVEIVHSWQEAYQDADIFITCTVSEKPYIDLKPKKGSLHANISLRDYQTMVYDWFKDCIIVDNWEEICRERTDIEMMHLERGLLESHTKSIIDLVTSNCIDQYPADAAVMFNPMGMAVFDIAVGAYYHSLIKANRCDAPAYVEANN